MRSGTAHPGSEASPVPASVIVAGLVVSVAAGGTVMALGLWGMAATLPVGALLSGFIALLSGLVLLVRGSRGERRALFRGLLGAALVVWAIGQLWNGGLVILTSPAFPTVGDMISLLAAPLGVAGVLAIPRRTAGPHPGWRLGLDSALLGITLALLCWQLWFVKVFGEDFGVGDALAIVVLVADITIMCLGALAFVRDLERDLLVVWLGACCYTFGDLIMMYSTLQVPGRWPWQAAALWCLAWPLISAGLLRYSPTASAEPRRTPVDPDARGVMITTTVSLTLLLLGLGLLAVHARPDRVAICLVIGAVGLFWARELLNARFRAQLLRRLNDEATADPLTGLANRRVLAAQLAALPPGEPWCLLTVDLDGFKDVNDLLGHATGDRLLAAVARRLSEAAPPEALVSRIGGDEFAVLLPGDMRSGAAVGERIVTAVRRSAVDVEGVARVEVSASVGVAAVHAGGVVERELLVLPEADPLDGGALGVTTAQAVATAGRAVNGELGDLAVLVDGVPLVRSNGAHLGRDGILLGLGPVRGAASAEPVPAVDPLGALSASGAALRLAKAGGRNRVEVYDASVAQLRKRRLQVEERLRMAVESDAITVLFQPIVDLRQGIVYGAEALARWTDPELGAVDAGEFIPVAEQTGLVVALGERVLDEMLRTAVQERLFERGLRLNCNVSPVQLRVAGFHRVVEEAIAAHRVDRSNVVIEVTEQVLVEEGQATQTLRRLADHGITIAIDDFGTGYSALGYLQRLPAEVLKIDRSLTSSLVGEPRSRAITRAVLDLGRTVGLTVVVEGVESEQIDDLVRRMGVGFAQGTYYGPAMSGAALAALADRLFETPRLA